MNGTTKCEICEKPIINGRKGRKYCGTQCRVMAWAFKKQESLKKTVPTSKGKPNGVGRPNA